MSCFSRPEWAEVFQCTYAHLAEPVSIRFPFGLTYLVVFAVGGGIGAALMYAAGRVFGEGIFHPFELLADAAWYMRRLPRRLRASARDRWRKRQPTAGQEGETPAGTQEEATIEQDTAEKALAGRREERE